MKEFINVKTAQKWTSQPNRIIVHYLTSVDTIII